MIQGIIHNDMSLPLSQTLTVKTSLSFVSLSNNRFTFKNPVIFTSKYPELASVKMSCAFIPMSASVAKTCPMSVSSVAFSKTENLYQEKTKGLFINLTECMY